ncbi:hypothetical protein AX15_007914 [Amanita polypyramis BW_CC]|nr:hypothetical protein AX15_007914 [Amanita polypyramis BW_CC]
MPPALLVAFSEPGPLIPLSEFQDWYESEHIPLRMNHLPSFLTCARFHNTSSPTTTSSPSWLALYDIEDTSTFQHDSYTRLRTNRSERETNLIRRIEVLDRRCCELVWDSASDSGVVLVESGSTSLGVGNPTEVIVSHGLEDVDGDKSGVVGWARGVVERLRGTSAEPVRQGWIRTRLFKSIDTLKVGTSISPGPEAQKAPPFLVLHEFLTQDAADRVIHHIQQGDHHPEELTKWQLYRAYPNLAPVPKA